MDDLTEAELSHEIYLNKLSSFYANKWGSIQPNVISALRLAFSELDEIQTKAEVNELNDSIEQLLLPILDEFILEQEQAIDELIEKEVEFQAEILSEQGITITAAAIAGAIATSRRNYRNTLVVVGSQGVAEDIKKRLSDYPKSTIAQIKDINLGAYTQGQSLNDARLNVTGTAKNKYSDGYIATMKRNIQSLIKTSRKHAEIQSKTAVFKKAGSNGYVLTAVLDSRTSDICLGWNGTIVLWSQDYQPLPPFHFNCRTTIIPYFNGVTQIPEGGFNWLKKQSAQFQDDLIGPTRGDLLRNSGLTSEEYRKASRNNLNEPITLNEMAKKNEEISNRLRQKKQGV